jgi:predicted PurR-regulated permease PerM
MAAFVVVVAGLRAAQSIITPLLLAIFLAVICFPPLAWLKRKGLPDWLALLVVLGGSVLVVLAVVGLMGTSLADFTARLPKYTEELVGNLKEATHWLKEHNIDVGQAANLEGLDAERLTGLATTVLGTLGSLTSELVVVLLIFVFLLIEVAGFRAKLQAMPGYSSDDDHRLGKVIDDIRHYLAIKTQVSLISAVVIGIWLTILGVDFVILWAILAFFFNYVPNIGSIISAIPAVLLALVQLGPLYAVYAAAGYLAVDGLIGNVIEPRMMGRGLGLSTLVVFLSLLFWGWVLGPVGMLMSVPLTILVRIALERSEETRWIAILLAAHPEETPGGASATKRQ